MRVLRLTMAASLALGVAACDSGNVPSPAERAEGDAQSQPVADGSVALRGDGLAAGADSFFFAAGQAEVTTALTASLGEPLDTGVMEECGAGSMQYANFPEGLTVNFQEGALVGWLQVVPSERVRMEGVNLGSAQADVEAMAGYTAIEGSTVGNEFALGDNVGGFFDGGEVNMLYAGTQCFMR